MGRINLGRVVIGGLLAGIIINIGEFILNGVLLAEQMNCRDGRAQQAADQPEHDHVVRLFGFGLGCMLVWTYAAIRPRFGAGVKTAICASTLVWGLAYLYPNLFMVIIDIFPTRHDGHGDGLGLVEFIVAGIAGAWAYTEVHGLVRAWW